LNRYFLKVQCKLNGSGLQYVRVRGVLSQGSHVRWQARTHGCSESFGDTGYRVYPVRNHHFHPPICSKIAQELRYIDWVATTPLLLYTYWSLARRDGWQRPFWPLALAVVTMIVMGYIAEATDNKYSPLLCSHIFTFCTKSEVSKAVRRKG
jgi:bacteriorhodopsin